MFCQNCGSQVDGKFCTNCGTAVGGVAATQAPVQTAPVQSANSSFEEIVLWEDQPSGLADKAKTAMKVNSVYYKITSHRVVVNTGLIGKKEEEIELSKINDYKVKQSVSQRLLKVGDVHITTYDTSSPLFVFNDIQNPNEVKEILRRAVLEYKQRTGVRQHETY